MNCLNCGTEMTTYDVATKKSHISYNACDKCGSLWLDAGALDKLAFQVQGSIEYCERTDEDSVAEKNPPKCPRCDDSQLEEVKFLGCDDILLHTCRNCGGFWLDSGELNLIDKELAKIMPVSGHGFSDFVNNVHVPYWFRRVQRPSGQTDFSIEVPPIPGAERVKASTSDSCPVCAVPLAVYSLLFSKFEACPKCKGVWLTQDELRNLKNREDDGTLRWLDEEIDNPDKISAVAGKLSCPHCKSPKMVSVIFGNSKIVMDRCPQCRGVWLERGEFEQMTDYWKRELGLMKPKQIEQLLAKDLKGVLKGAPEGRWQELLDAKAAAGALVNASILEHPALVNLLETFPHFFG